MTTDTNELDYMANRLANGTMPGNARYIFSKDDWEQFKAELIDWAAQAANKAAEAAIVQDYLDHCFPSSDHDDIRNGNYTGGGYISENIILDRIKALITEQEGETV